MCASARPARPSGQRWDATNYTIDCLEHLRGYLTGLEPSYPVRPVAGEFGGGSRHSKVPSHGGRKERKNTHTRGNPTRPILSVGTR